MNNVNYYDNETVTAIIKAVKTLAFRYERDIENYREQTPPLAIKVKTNKKNINIKIKFLYSKAILQIVLTDDGLKYIITQRTGNVVTDIENLYQTRTRGYLPKEYLNKTNWLKYFDSIITKDIITQFNEEVFKAYKILWEKNSPKHFFKADDGSMMYNIGSDILLNVKDILFYSHIKDCFSSKLITGLKAEKVLTRTGFKNPKDILFIPDNNIDGKSITLTTPSEKVFEFIVQKDLPDEVIEKNYVIVWSSVSNPTLISNDIFANITR